MLKTLQATVAVIFVLCSCTAKVKDTDVPLQTTDKRELASAELQRLYRAAQSEQERRAVCLRSIDEGFVRRGGPVLVLDQILGTHFASDLPREGEIKQAMPILFATQYSPPPRPDGLAVAIGYVGSYLAVDYDHKGNIEYYYLSNLHKGASGRIDSAGSVPVTELKQLYDRAKTELERRDVALRAIDGDVIRTRRPGHVSTIDAIFGTHLASRLPTKREHTRTGIVDFNSRAGPGPEGWFMAVDYDSDGNITNYYITNIPR